MSTTITSSPAFLLKSDRSFVVRPLPMSTAVHTLCLFLMSYATWLIPLPALSLGGSCRLTTSAFRSTPVSSAAMAHTYDLAQLRWITLNIGGSDSRSVSRFSASPRSCRGSWCGQYWRCRCRWRRALHHCDVFCLHSPFLCIGHLLFAPAPLSSRWPRPQDERCPDRSWGWSRGLHGPSCWFSSPPLPCLPGGLRLLCAPTAERDVVPFAVRALLLCVAAERALLCNATHDVAFMGAGAVRSWAVAACRFAAPLALYVAPSAAMLTSAVWAYIGEWFDSVQHSRHLDALLTSLRATLWPFTTKTTDDAEISPFCLLSVMLWGFASHRTWTGITTSSFSAWISSRIVCRPSVPLSMYLTSCTEWTLSLPQESFSSTSKTPMSTVRAALMMTSRYSSAIAAIAFWSVIAVIAPFGFLLAFIIRMWAAVFWWRSPLLIADAISWSILLGRGIPSSLLEIRRLSAMLDPDSGAGPGFVGALWLWVRGWTVSHLLAGVVVGLGLGLCCWSDCCLSCSLGLGFGCCCSWSFSGSPPCIAPACWEAPMPSLSCLPSRFFRHFSLSESVLLCLLSRWPAPSRSWPRCPPLIVCRPCGGHPISSPHPPAILSCRAIAPLRAPRVLPAL